jgi:hypothetical protein
MALDPPNLRLTAVLSGSRELSDLVLRSSRTHVKNRVKNRMIDGILKALHTHTPSPFNQAAKIDHRVRTEFEPRTALSQKLDVMVSPCPLSDSYD